MANFLTFVRGQTYTLNVYNRIFAEHIFLISTVNTGQSYSNLVTNGVTYKYAKSDGTLYTGEVNYDLDTFDVYTGATYTANSELLDIYQVIFRPNAAHPDTLYIQSGKDLNMGKTIYIVDSVGDIINSEQFFYILGIGHEAEVLNLSYYDKFVEYYIKQVLPASVEGIEYTI